MVESRGTDVLTAALSVVWVLRVPGVVALFCGALLAIPGGLASEQLYESVQNAAESPGTCQWLILAGTTAWLCLTLHVSAIVALHGRQLPNHSSVNVHNAIASHLAWVATVMPLGAVSIACMHAAAPGGGSRNARIALWVAASAFGVAMVPLGIFAHRRTSSLTTIDVSALRVSIRAQFRTMPRYAKIVLSTSALTWMVGIVLASSPLVSSAEVLGPASVILAGLAAWAAIGTLLVTLGYALKIPLIGISVAAAILFSALDLNDNHKVRLASKIDRHNLPIDDDLPTDYAFPSRALGTFHAWLMSRKDLNAYVDSSYPVIVVSTEGGGIRAAYLTAYVLASIQDRCPGFAEHVFAVSSVSGGSLGAGVFAGLMARSARFSGNGVCDPTPTARTHFQDSADRMLRRDFLSPLLSAMLFPDLVQQFWFLAVNSFDRAVALERSFEKAWEETTGGKEFSENFFALWSDRGLAVPPLVMNVTVVESGERIVITPHSIWEPVLARLRSPVRLSTAIGLSSRFPYVTPAGWVEYFGSGLAKGWRSENILNDKIRLVDGGYYENSGAASLIDLVGVIGSTERLLKRSGRWPTKEAPPYHFLVVTISTLTAEEIFPGQWLGEFLSPMRTLINARSARTLNASQALKLSAHEFQSTGNNLSPLEKRSFEFVLCPQSSSPIPLGWFLSERARSAIRSQVHDQAVCKRPWGSTSESNAEMLERLISHINPPNR
jgi:hypothetical protein